MFFQNSVFWSEPFLFFWKFTSIISSSQPNYLHCSSMAWKPVLWHDPWYRIVRRTARFALSSRLGCLRQLQDALRGFWKPSLQSCCDGWTRYPVIHLVLCWMLLLLPESQQRESRPVHWLLHLVAVSLNLTWKSVCTKMPKWELGSLWWGHVSKSSRGVSENSGQRCL